ncbi:MAG: hypothetical protein ACRDOI_15050 [Trebonia sp.]
MTARPDSVSGEQVGGEPGDVLGESGVGPFMGASVLASWSTAASASSARPTVPELYDQVSHARPVA